MTQIKWTWADLCKMLQSKCRIQAKEMVRAEEIHHCSAVELKNWGEPPAFFETITSICRSLHDMASTDIWIAHKYISNPTGDGGKTRIPTLQKTNPDGQNTHATTNKEKSEVLAQAPFPPPPAYLASLMVTM